MNRNKLMIFTLFFIIGGTMIGCGGSEKEVEEKKKKPSIVGKWESDLNITKQALKDAGLEGEILETTLNIWSSLSMTLEFKESGALSMSKTGLGEPTMGEWKLDGTYLSLRQEDSDEWEAKEISLNRNELVIIDGEESIGLKRVK